jgi:hypothetical protein
LDLAVDNPEAIELQHGDHADDGAAMRAGPLTSPAANRAFWSNRDAPLAGIPSE